MESVEKRKKKFLVMLPVIALPFLAFMFHSLGGGRPKASEKSHAGLNATLPAPLLENDQPMDKLSLYRQAERDSLKKEQDYDPFGKWLQQQDTTASPDSFIQPGMPGGYDPYPYSVGIQPFNPRQEPAPERKVEKRLRELEQMLATPPADTPSPLQQPASLEAEQQLQQLESLMQEFGTGNQLASQPDPELSQMEGMLNKILDIQHPDRIRERLKQQSRQHKGSVYPVSAIPPPDVIDLLAVTPRISRADTGNRPQLPATTAFHGFHELDGNVSTAQDNSLAAVIHQNQTLTSGSTIKLRLLQDAYLQGQLLAKGSFVHGTCALNGERLNVEVASIRIGGSVYPVALTAYDLDGMTGIRILGSINREAAKDGTEQAVQAISMGSLDPSVGAQATAAGIEAAKTLLKRRVKTVWIHVKADYPVLLAADRQ